MTERDSRLKQNIREALHRYLYAPPLMALDKEKDSLIQRNQLLQGHDVAWFSFKGRWYYSAGQFTSRPKIVPRLHHSLTPMALAWVQEEKELEVEQDLVLNTLTTILNASRCLADYRRILPESMHSPLNAFNGQGASMSFLSTEHIEDIQAKTEHGISLMRQRMVRNLIM